MTGRAIQIASFDAARKLKLHKTELDSILNQPQLAGLFIAVYSFVGAYRTGKSFTLSILERFLRSNIDRNSSNWLAQLNDNDEPLSDGFKWRGGSKGETQGIWAWSQVFVVDGPAGQKVGLLLMDTQGLFDRSNTEQQDGKIFTLSTLISSIQIFNMKNIMQEDKLANLHLFSEFGRRAIAKKNQHSSTDSSTDSSDSVKAFQRIIFLIRDWQCPTEYPFGSEGGSRYIEEFFNISREMGGTDLAQRRKYIRRSFDQVDCYLMPFPGTKVANGDTNFTGRLSEMEDEFKEHLEKFISFMFPHGRVETKRMAGNQVLASDLSSYVEYFVNLLNSDQTLSVQSISQATTTIHNSSVARNAVKEYRTCVTAFEESNSEDTFQSVNNMERQHEGFYRKALDFFAQHQMGDAGPNSPILDQLKKDLVKEFENWKKRNELVEARIINLNEYALKEAVKEYSSTMDDWFNLNKTRKPFLEMTELLDHHQEVKQNSTESMKSQLKGGTDLAPSLIQRLGEFVESYFYNFIVAENESNRKHEEYRVEITNIINQLDKEREDKEKAIRAAAEAEIARVKAEAEQQRKEDEIKAKEEEDATKLEQINRELQRQKEMVAQIEQKIKEEMNKKIQEQEENHRLTMEKLRAEEAQRERMRDQERRIREEERIRGGFWNGVGDFVKQVAIPLISLLIRAAPK